MTPVNFAYRHRFCNRGIYRRAIESVPASNPISQFLKIVNRKRLPTASGKRLPTASGKREATSERLHQWHGPHQAEVAAEVVQKLEPCEASALFIEGLMHPIQKVMQMDGNENLSEKLADCMKKAESITDHSKACHCQCSCATENSFKEPLSAPF
ncbi:hypothetical protein LR48_Vigan406s019500 [Vigna angularis]|uniref:Uncharacterized protein n=1 Tax=Phaseolus angularis TaxID=3914 RepID=A0A0L9T9U6_PHAAN|nr:hypothetical protein LR48_Vigan406s019500 [Vigna angularis]